MKQTLLCFVGICLTNASTTGAPPVLLTKPIVADGMLMTTTVESSSNSEFVCGISGAESADDILNSIVFIWAAAERCNPSHSAVQCSVDVSYALESVLGMTNSILKAAQGCTDRWKGTHLKCKLSLGKLAEGLAGVAATSSAIALHCPKHKEVQEKPLLPKTSHDWLVYRHQLAHCFVDVKSLMKGIMKAVVGLTSASTDCSADPYGPKCVRGSLQVIAAIASMGEYISGAVGHCSSPVNQDAACGSEILGLLKELSSLAKAGDSIYSHCTLNEAERLYLQTDVNSQTPHEAAANLGIIVLTSLIPLTVVFSFVAGMRLATAHMSDTEGNAKFTKGVE